MRPSCISTCAAGCSALEETRLLRVPDRLAIKAEDAFYAQSCFCAASRRRHEQQQRCTSKAVNNPSGMASLAASREIHLCILSTSRSESTLRSILVNSHFQRSRNIKCCCTNSPSRNAPATPSRKNKRKLGPFKPAANGGRRILGAPNESLRSSPARLSALLT